jgi:cell division septum initiation protein DivIVA
VWILTEKELKKLNRYQLLEMLLIQTQRADSLQKQLEEAQSQLDDREIRMTVMGSLAEASLQLSGVFEAAQNAADLYMRNVEKKAALIEAEAQQKAELILAEARRNARKILQDAELERRVRKSP